MSVHAAVTVNRLRDQVEDLWRSTGPGPDYADAADVSFKDAPGDRGTEIHVVLDRDAPAGALGEALQNALGAGLESDAAVREAAYGYRPERTTERERRRHDEGGAA